MFGRFQDRSTTRVTRHANDENAVPSAHSIIKPGANREGFRAPLKPQTRQATGSLRKGARSNRKALAVKTNIGSSNGPQLQERGPLKPTQQRPKLRSQGPKLRDVNVPSQPKRAEVPKKDWLDIETVPPKEKIPTFDSGIDLSVFDKIALAPSTPFEAIDIEAEAANLDLPPGLDLPEGDDSDSDINFDNMSDGDMDVGALDELDGDLLQL